MTLLLYLLLYFDISSLTDFFDFFDFCGYLEVAMYCSVGNIPGCID